MFCQSQAFTTEKKPEKAKFCLAFSDFQKSQRCSKEVRISNSGFKKAKVATLVSNPAPSFLLIQAFYIT